MRDVVQSGIGVVLKINDIAVAGQENAKLTRSMTPIGITNKINAEWDESISGIKSWNILCNGSYVKDAESFNLLEQAFMNNKEITVKVFVGNNHYLGQALITNFPLTANYNAQYKYSISLLGTGELRLIRDDIAN